MADEEKTVRVRFPARFDDYEVMSTLMDALSEFVASRCGGNGEEYVNKRYPKEEKGWGLYEAEARARKIVEVERRCRIARTLRENVNIKIEK